MPSLSRSLAALGACILLLSASACSDSSTWSATRLVGTTPALVTTADLRLVMERTLSTTSDGARSAAVHA